MDTIVTPVTVITLDSTSIVHSIKADLVARYFPPVVRLVQYDQSLPVIAVSLMQNGQTYTLPSGAAANIRVHKPDSTYVYNPALGCDSTRKIVYFEVTQAMAAASGDGLAIVEIVVDGDIAGTSLITLHFEENPVPEDAIESSDEWKTIYELGERIIASTVTPVSTAAGMTDHNVVYLYTGTESGWNQGHMYYYNGTTWVDAGIAVTDTTLSVAGLAADAKKTGDEIADLKEDLTQNVEDISDLYVKNNISVIQGINSTNNSAISYNNDGTFTVATNDYGNTTFNALLTLEVGVYYLYGVQEGIAFLTPTASASTAYIDRVVENTTNDLLEFAITTRQTLYLGFRIAARPANQIVIRPTVYKKTSFKNVAVKKSTSFDIVEGLTAIDYGWVNASGQIRPDEDEVLAYSDYISVTPGDVLNSNGVGHTVLRFVAAYDRNKQIVSASGSNDPVSTYTVPNGIEFVIVSLYLEMAHDLTTMPSITIHKADGEYVLPMIDTTLQSPVLPPPAKEVGIVYADYKKDKSIIKRGNLGSSDKWEFEENNISTAKVLAFSGTITSFSAVQMGHGKTESEGNYIKVDATNVYEYVGGTLRNTYPHGLTVQNNIQVKIEVKSENAYRAYLTLISSGSVFTQTMPSWYGDSGKLFVESVGSTMTDCSFGWTCENFNKPVYIFGDSYLGFATDNRWPYYLIRDGYHQLLDGYGGRNSLWALRSLKNDLLHGTPKFVFWCMGMNDPDTTEVNASWLSSVNEVISLCNDQGITPILATIPNVTNTAKNNTYKNAWVRNSGYRYVDFAVAVGGVAQGATWYPDMLNSDGTHPNTKGAVALYYQVLSDFPEIAITEK